MTESARRTTGGGNGNRGVEENTMAILDSSGFNNSKTSHHLNDDRLAFLEAVRTACLLADNGSSPTRKMFDALFHILRDADSLDLIIQSYQLLIELDKCFPRLYLSKGGQVDSLSPAKVLSHLVVVEEAWLPFNLGLQKYDPKDETAKYTRSSLDPLLSTNGFIKNNPPFASVIRNQAYLHITFVWDHANAVSLIEICEGFHSLIEEVSKSEAEDTVSLKNMLLLEYLITALDGDFWLRNSAYQENMDWTLLRESLLNQLLGSRKVVYKGLIKDCLSILFKLSQPTVFPEEASCHETSSGEMLHETHTALALALPKVKSSLCTLLKKFLVMIMELDSSRKIADQQGLTSRADGTRTPVVEIILDELTYENDILYAFLQILDEPKWKLDIIVKFFQKYTPKTALKTRRSKDAIDADNFDGVLKCLSNRSSTRNLIKKIKTEVVQLLLAFAFQAYLAQSYQHVSDGISDPMEDDGTSSPILEVCKNVVTAFTCLRQEDRHTEILPLCKEALFTAATILSTKS